MDRNRLDLDSISSLVPMARDGDRNAQNQIFDQIQDVILALVKQQFGEDLRQRQNPSDVVQKTMTRIINGFGEFRGNNEKEFFGWVTTIVKNEIHLARRHQYQAKRDLRREIIADDNHSNVFEFGRDGNRTPSSEAIQKEKVELLNSALERLPQEFATIIRLRSLDELSFPEIAESLNKSTNAVTKMWKRAVIQLERELDGLGLN